MTGIGVLSAINVKFFRVRCVEYVEKETKGKASPISGKLVDMRVKYTKPKEGVWG